MQTGISLERQVTESATVSLTYLNSRGEHQLFLRDINAIDPTTGVRPLFGTYGNTKSLTTISAEFPAEPAIANMRLEHGFASSRCLVSTR